MTIDADRVNALLGIAAALILPATMLGDYLFKAIKADHTGSVRRKTVATIRGAIRLFFIAAAAVALIQFNRYGIAAFLILAVTASDSRDFLRLSGPPTREEIFFLIMQWIGALGFLMIIMGAILLTLIEGNTERTGELIKVIPEIVE